MTPVDSLRRHASPPEPGPIRPFHLPPVSSGTAGGGVRVLSLTRPEIPLASGCIVLDAGESTAPGDRGGIAVLAGDILTGGTESRDAFQLAEALERLGVSLRVSTGWDATTLSFTTLADRLDATLEVVSEVLRTAVFPEPEVERVRRQRLAAIRQRRMDPGQLASDELNRTLFPQDHPYHRGLSGEVESVAAIEREEVLAFAERRYRPDRGAFIMVGDLAEAQVHGAVDRHLSGWVGSVVASESPSEAPKPDARPVVLVHRPGAVQSEIRIGQVGPSRSLEGEAELDVGNAVLGGSFTSRLNLNLREKHGFTYGVRSGFARRRSGGLFSIGTAVQTEVTVAALQEALFEFRRFVAHGPEESEVRQARDYLAGVFPLRMETAPQIAARLAELHIFGLPLDYHHGYRERIRAVTPGSIHEVLAGILDPEGAAIVVVGDADHLQGPLEGLGLGDVQVQTEDTDPVGGMAAVQETSP